jgi:hypothetical protein
MATGRRSNRRNPGGDSKLLWKVRTAMTARIGDISACGWNSLSDFWRNSLSDLWSSLSEVREFPQRRREFFPQFPQRSSRLAPRSLEDLPVISK